MTIRTVLLTASALVLAAACNPSATETPAPAPAPAAPIADPATPAPSGPAAENTTDSLSSTPAAPSATPAPAAPGGVTVADSPTLEQIATAKVAYAASCAMCHGPTGQGTQMGVSLVNVLEAAVIKEKVTKGMINPGDKMPPMGPAMSADTLDALAKFVAAGLPQ